MLVLVKIYYRDAAQNNKAKSKTEQNAVSFITDSLGYEKRKQILKNVKHRGISMYKYTSKSMMDNNFEQQKNYS